VLCPTGASRCLRTWAADAQPSLARPPGDGLLAVVGAAWWTGTERYLGADMFWDHADIHAYLRWFRESRLLPVWHRFVSEGNTGHGLILATAS
jgi:hypothetical protein